MNQAQASLATESMSRADVFHSGRPTVGTGIPLPLLLAVSVGAHVGIAGILAALPTVGRLAGLPEDLIVAVDFFEVEALAEAAPLPPEPPPPVAVAPRAPRPVRAETPPAEVAPEPPAPPVVAAAMPPSVDDVFGEPPPPMESLTASGGGAFVVPAGEPGGVPGGRAGGTPGGTIGAGGVEAIAARGDDGSERRHAREAYKRVLERFLRDRMSYPRAAARERIEGRVELALRIGSDGALLGVRVASSSGHDLLDREALATARDCGRMPAPPGPCALLSSDELRVGMVYRLR